MIKKFNEYEYGLSNNDIQEIFIELKDIGFRISISENIMNTTHTRVLITLPEDDGFNYDIIKDKVIQFIEYIGTKYISCEWYGYDEKDMYVRVKMETGDLYTMENKIIQALRIVIDQFA